MISCSDLCHTTSLPKYHVASTNSFQPKPTRVLNGHQQFFLHHPSTFVFRQQQRVETRRRRRQQRGFLVAIPLNFQFRGQTTQPPNAGTRGPGHKPQQFHFSRPIKFMHNVPKPTNCHVCPTVPPFVHRAVFFQRHLNMTTETKQGSTRATKSPPVCPTPPHQFFLPCPTCFLLRSTIPIPRD